MSSARQERHVKRDEVSMLEKLVLLLKLCLVVSFKLFIAFNIVIDNFHAKTIMHASCQCLANCSSTNNTEGFSGYISAQEHFWSPAFIFASAREVVSLDDPMSEGENEGNSMFGN